MFCLLAAGGSLGACGGLVLRLTVGRLWRFWWTVDGGREGRGVARGSAPFHVFHVSLRSPSTVNLQLPLAAYRLPHPLAGQGHPLTPNRGFISQHRLLKQLPSAGEILEDIEAGTGGGEEDHLSGLCQQAGGFDSSRAALRFDDRGDEGAEGFDELAVVQA